MKNIKFLTLLLLALSLPPASAADHGFTFTGPDIEGWVEIPPKDAGAPEGVVLIYMSNDESWNFNAGVAEGKVAMTDALMAQLRDNMAGKMASSGVADAQVLDARLVDIGGMPGLRMVSKGTYAGGPKSQLTYILPGKAHYATLTYTSNPESFDALVTAFDESAKQTKGLAKHGSTGNYALYGMLIGGAVAVLYSLYKKFSD